MKQVYSVFKKSILLFTLTGAINLAAKAQNPTTIYNAGDCNIIQTFDTTSGGFSSSSIYSESTNTYFNWISEQGYWLENTNYTERTASMLSGVYKNMQMSGSVTLGFKYKAPEGSLYRIRVIKASCNCGIQESIVANTVNGGLGTPLPATEGRVCIYIMDNDIYQGENLRYEISITTKTGGDIIIDDFSLGERSAISLPVTFKGITARKEGNSTKVLWDVADEIDVREYVVERSNDGIQYNAIGTVNAQQKNVYTYTDGRDANGTVYYRVKNVDVDGKFKYSSVVRINTGKTLASLKAFPLPAKNNITIEHGLLTAKGTISITTAEGKMVKKVFASEGSTHTTIDITNFTSGMYMVHMDKGTGTAESLKFIKQ